MEQLKDQVLTQLFAGKKAILLCIVSLHASKCALFSECLLSSCCWLTRDMEMLLQCCSRCLLVGWAAAAKVQCGQ